MMITSEKATQKSITCSRLSVHQESFLWALSARSSSSPPPSALWPQAVSACPSGRSRPATHIGVGLGLCELLRTLNSRSSENFSYAKFVNTAVPRSYRAVAPGVATPGRYYEFIMYRNEAPYCT